jgi:hypothetical protein
MLLHQMRLFTQRLVPPFHLFLLLVWQLDQLLSFQLRFVLLLLVVVVILLIHHLNEHLILHWLLSLLAALLSNLVVKDASDLNVFIILLFLLEHVLLLGFLVRLNTTWNVLPLLLLLKFFVFANVHLSHLFHDRLDLVFTGLNLVITFLDLSFLTSSRLLN